MRQDGESAMWPGSPAQGRSFDMRQGLRLARRRLRDHRRLRLGGALTVARRTTIELPVPRQAEIRQRFFAVNVRASARIGTGDAWHRLLAVFGGRAAPFGTWDARHRLLAVVVWAERRLHATVRVPRAFSPFLGRISSDRACPEARSQGEYSGESSQTAHGPVVLKSLKSENPVLPYSSDFFASAENILWRPRHILRLLTRSTVPGRSWDFGLGALVLEPRPKPRLLRRSRHPSTLRSTRLGGRSRIQRPGGPGTV